MRLEGKKNKSVLQFQTCGCESAADADSDSNNDTGEWNDGI